jgi:hypothetical protein
MAGQVPERAIQVKGDLAGAPGPAAGAWWDMAWKKFRGRGVY